MGTSAISMADFATYGDVGYSGWYNFYQNMNKVIDAVNAKQISPDIFDQIVNPETGQYVKPTYSKSGRVIGVEYYGKPTFTTPNEFNSNAAITRRGTVRTPLVTGNNAGAVTTGRITPPSSVPTRAYIANSIASPLVAVGTGIALGKTIDSTLYNLNPDFWDANGMSTLNPETWNNITLGIDHTDPVTGVAADLMNVIYGLDPDGTVQAYVDQDAFAYMASYMARKGVFDEGEGVIDGYVVPGWGTATAPIYYMEFPLNELVQATNGNYYYTNFACLVGGTFGEVYSSYLAATEPGRSAKVAVFPSGNRWCVAMARSHNDAGGDPAIQIAGGYIATGRTANRVTFDGKTVKYRNDYGSGTSSLVSYYRSIINPSAADNEYTYVAWLMQFGAQHKTSGVEGIGTQEGATLPDPSQMQTTADALQYLPTVYPDMWNNAVTLPVVQPDGSVDTHTYVPINIPIGNGNGDTQPTSGEETQANPKIDPSTSPAELVDLIQKLLQQPEEEPYSDDLPEDVEPPDTGSGDTPQIVAPTGEASALWSIYNPTQAQVDAFGAWLWSPNFVDQIAKIFNNPMESIIGLHKVFATPSTPTSGTIRVGYLDSGVQSAIVGSQYTSVDCGTVNLAEQFANVLDYAPYTEIKLYLPFVGIVQLDPAYVMRATIGVVYKVDVLTGACLAMVDVRRDGESGGTLYQYAGDCAVQYPISSGSYMGIVAGIAGAVGSVAATLATGGGALPLILGAGGAIAGAHTQVQNSGSFGGNAGAMGGKKPYLIISRPQSKVAEGFERLQGYPTNYGTVIGDCSGLVVCSQVRGIVGDMTADEREEILELLAGGVIV